MRIRQINIPGNDKTKDNVIRRELRVDEQDVIDTPSLKRSFQRLNNLNFFETVEILPQQVEPTRSTSTSESRKSRRAVQHRRRIQHVG